MPSFIREGVALAPYTTLGIGGQAEFFCEVDSLPSLKEVIAWARANKQQVTPLGGGSNILIDSKGISGLVVRPCFTEKIYTQDADQISLYVGAGIELDTVIVELVSKGLWGLENLSGIPGSVGAVPIQNVGAYGVEAREVINSVTVFNQETGEVELIHHTECRFGYRHSLFKESLGKRYIVIGVTFSVTSKGQPRLHYRDLQTAFHREQVPSLDSIRNMVLEIRSHKFPDWHIMGNAGSFFKNPVISSRQFRNLQNIYPDIPGFISDEGRVKVSLGWILDHICQLRGFQKGNVGLYKDQALIVVCRQGTLSEEVLSFVKYITNVVYEKTGIHIEPEVTSIINIKKI